MRRSMIVLSALMMISSVMFAQQKNKAAHGARLEKMKSELSLNDTQYASIKGINKKYAEQISKIKKDSTSNKTEKHSAVKTLREQKAKEVNAVLTADQKTKYEKLKQERRDKRMAERTARANEHQAKLTKDLGLNDDQALKVKDANKAFIQNVKALRERSGESKVANKEEIKKLRKEHEATMKSLLTDAQFKKWKELRKVKEKQGKPRKVN
jgi:hypothetical protein